VPFPRFSFSFLARPAPDRLLFYISTLASGRRGLIPVLPAQVHADVPRRFLIRPHARLHASLHRPRPSCRFRFVCGSAPPHIRSRRPAARRNPGTMLVGGFLFFFLWCGGVVNQPLRRHFVASLVLSFHIAGTFLSIVTRFSPCRGHLPSYNMLFFAMARLLRWS